MAFWDYLIFIQMGGKFLKSYGSCIKEKQAEDNVVDFPDRLFCLGKAMEDTFAGVMPPAPTKIIKKVKAKKLP